MTNASTRPGLMERHDTPAPAGTSGSHEPRRLLITAGPTHEPIDAVRFIANRSSGRLGIALAEAGANAGWRVRLLLGPTPRGTADTRIDVRRFQTTADLEALLADSLDWCNVLVMAAAVADYRPATRADAGTKLRRSGKKMSLELESTPDLLAGCSARRKPGQLLVGFALEPRAELDQSARSKLARKGVDLIVANPLETMDAPTIEATVYDRDGGTFPTPGAIDKSAFAGWLLDRIAAATAMRR